MWRSIGHNCTLLTHSNAVPAIRILSVTFYGGRLVGQSDGELMPIDQSWYEAEVKPLTEMIVGYSCV